MNALKRIFCIINLAAQTSVLDLLKDLENVVEDDGKLLISKV